MIKAVLLSLSISIPFWVLGQNNDSLQEVRLDEVVVTAYKEKPLKETSFAIEAVKIDSLSQQGNFNLTDLIAMTPGIDMLTTGVAINKPVIRGLYGNRILILLSGLKFDNQQWQEEHGLGLSDIGLSKVEIIKGPMGVLYGSEAMGGVINLIEEKKAENGKSEGDISIKLNSNTLGGMIQGGYKVNKGNKWWRLRLGVENNADYSDGNNERLLNSRFKGYYLKASFGKQNKHWDSNTNFMSSFNQSGFIFNDIYTFITPDERWSRDLSVNPSHLVFLNILSSENDFYLKNGSKLNLNIGVQSNERMENEGGGAISLNMHLITIQYLLKWERQLSAKNKLIISHLGSFENNSNFGARKIVPDANMEEANLSGFLESTLSENFIWENGIGFGEKWIKTFLTPTVNESQKEIDPFSKFSPYYNFFSGITYFPNNGFNLKLNVATGVRIPNLAELSSDGLHEGIFTYEIGDPDLENEQNLSLNIYTNFQHKAIALSISPFYNLFKNYVYLAPTAEDWFGFPIYRYMQQNATQFGTEASLEVEFIKKLKAGIAYSGMVSKTEDGNYTPYIPAQKITPSINYTFSVKHYAIHCFSNINYAFAQNNLAPNEIGTPEYWLLNAGINTSFIKNNITYNLSMSGNNLLNTAYYDHLSRFKYFGLLNMGRNIVISLKVKFGN